MPEVSIKRSSVPNKYDYIMKHRLTLSFTTHFTHDIILSNIGIHWHSNIKWVNPACLVWKNLQWQPSGIPRNPGRLERRNSIHTADVTKILWVGKAFQHQTQLYTHRNSSPCIYAPTPRFSQRGRRGKADLGPFHELARDAAASTAADAGSACRPEPLASTVEQGYSKWCTVDLCSRR